MLLNAVIAIIFHTSAPTSVLFGYSIAKKISSPRKSTI